MLAQESACLDKVSFLKARLVFLGKVDNIPLRYVTFSKVRLVSLIIFLFPNLIKPNLT